MILNSMTKTLYSEQRERESVVVIDGAMWLSALMGKSIRFLVNSHAPVEVNKCVNAKLLMHGKL